MKKKICSILLAAALALTVTACGSSGEYRWEHTGSDNKL